MKSFQRLHRQGHWHIHQNWLPLFIKQSKYFAAPSRGFHLKCVHLLYDSLSLRFWSGRIAATCIWRECRDDIGFKILCRYRGQNCLLNFIEIMCLWCVGLGKKRKVNPRMEWINEKSEKVLYVRHYKSKPFLNKKLKSSSSSQTLTQDSFQQM